MLTPLHQGENLLTGQGPRQPARLAQPQRPRRYRASGGDVVQERPVAAPVDPPPGDQLLRQHDPVAGLVVVEGEQRSQMPVHRRRAAASRGVVEHGHVGRRRPQPSHEPRDVFYPRRLDLGPDLGQELGPQLQTDCVAAHRRRGSVQRLQVRQKTFDRHDRDAVIAEHCPRLRLIRHHQPLDPHHASPLLGQHVRGRLRHFRHIRLSRSRDQRCMSAVVMPRPIDRRL